MTCRHNWDDPECSSFSSHLKMATDLLTKFNGEPESADMQKYMKMAINLAEKHRPELLQSSKSDNQDYTINQIHREGSNLVVKATYPNCSKCSYEGTKVMVFLNVTEADVIKWKEIDPHFSDDKRAETQAPSPAARFPASEEGWEDAIKYAKGKHEYNLKHYINSAIANHICTADDCCTQEERQQQREARNRLEKGNK